jgi:hypothetical protein
MQPQVNAEHVFAMLRGLPPDRIREVEKRIIRESLDRLSERVLYAL